MSHFVGCYSVCHGSIVYDCFLVCVFFSSNFVAVMLVHLCSFAISPCDWQARRLACFLMGVGRVGACRVIFSVRGSLDQSICGGFGGWLRALLCDFVGWMLLFFFFFFFPQPSCPYAIGRPGDWPVSLWGRGELACTGSLGQFRCGGHGQWLWGLVACAVATL
ncbi:hypothetical protein F5888DRAFT_1077906 [Russula emetica]|nr:hypothetical protein F5888DRAFT_1077906 [Russula emetica]